MQCNFSVVVWHHVGDNKPETLFMRELRKRGIMPTSTTDDGNDSGTLGTGTKTKEGENDKGASGSSGTGPFGTSTKSPPKQTDEREKSNQRERSMALNSEGIDVSISVFALLNKTSEAHRFGYSG